MKQFPISKTVTQRTLNQHSLGHRDRGWSEKNDNPFFGFRQAQGLSPYFVLLLYDTTTDPFRMYL